MRVCTIASGSSGNCVYVNDNDVHLLVDAGISRKRIVDGLKSINVTPEMLDGILITHEHIDHIKGIEIMMKYFDVPLFLTQGTYDGLPSSCKKQIKPELMNFLKADNTFTIGSLKITPFSISHDANEPVGYSIEAGEKKVSIATDLGKYDEYILGHLKESEVLIVEANYDVSMIETGPYPYHLKRRIQSEKGHLSNEDSGKLICDLTSERLQYVFLAHLSKENNMPEIAMETVKCAFWENTGLKEMPFKLCAAGRNEMSEIVVI